MRDRIEDIRSLAEYFVSRYGIDLAGAHCGISDSAIESLEGYSWPGNVRELENAIKRALVLSSGDVLTPEDFGFLAESAREAPTTDLGRTVSEQVGDALDAGQ